ncbi:MAG: hypothetical protein IKX16_02325 [Clostridia bacterium]|nr:hypothetical protein [Clostridia bacterium]
MDQWEIGMPDVYEREDEKEAKYELRLANERGEARDLEEEQPSVTTPEPPAKKKLKREMEREALARLESAARTVPDFENIIDWWDRLDANRERRERYHEISRSGDDLPLEYGAAEDGLCFPAYHNNAFGRQRQKGDFIETIFNCPYEIHELVTEPYLCRALRDLSEDHKEILYFLAVRAYSTKKTGELRGQTDRNIRKVRNTLLKKIYKKILPVLKRREEKGIPLTREERALLAEMKK